MRILMINLEFDCAGVSWLLKNAINEHTDHIAYHVAHRATFAACNTDYRFAKVDDILQYCEWADVLHFNQWIWTHQPDNHPFSFLKFNEYGKRHPFEQFIGKKKFVFHFHGGPHQIDPAYWIEQAEIAHAGLIKCDPISFPRHPQVRWMPNIVPTNLAPADMQADPLRVACMGDKHDIRRTNVLLYDNLYKLAIEHDFFGDIAYEKALSMRRGYQLSVDNTTQGFTGMWTWESMLMGQVALARLDPAAHKAYEQLHPDCPIVQCSNVDLVCQEINYLLGRPKEAQAIGRESKEWALKALDTTKLVNRYIDFYQEI